ncbi:gastrula zinc finger protein XlCGF28.1-like [Silurus meridionalis]|nr:gastrula zinc finger protein XlCGF28.1-like [Silurus meridionalis]
MVEARLREEVTICEQQYGFMPRKSTTDALFALRMLMEKYREGQRELHCVFVDLEKAYDRVERGKFKMAPVSTSPAPPKDERTLDHCYTTFKNSYKAQSRPSFGKSDHAAIFLMPVYKQRLKQESPVQREVARWTDQSVAALQDALDDADWDMFWRSSDDVNMFTEAVVGFIRKLADDTVQKNTIRTFPNQNPWVDKTIRDALRSRSAAYNMRLATGDMNEYKASSYSVCRAVKDAKRHYRRKLESQFQHGGSRSLWQGLRTITDYRTPSSRMVNMDASLADELNTFYARFEAAANHASGASGKTSVHAERAGEVNMFTISEHDVRKAFKRVNTRKAAGPDGITGRVLKACADQLAAVFTEIFNLSLKQRLLERWCQENNLLLNVSKTKELIVDFSTKRRRSYQPLNISGTPVERVDSFRYLGVHITQDLSWSCHINTLEKARQRLYHLRRLRDFKLPSQVLKTFYTCTIESVLTGSITSWFGNSTMQDRRALQRVVRSAERTIHTELPDLQDIYSTRCRTRARKIVKDLSHPNNGLFSLLRSGKRFRSLKANTERMRRSFFPQAIRSLNQETPRI